MASRFCSRVSVIALPLHSVCYFLRAMECAPCAEWRLIIALWRFGGLRRCSEVLRLRWTDVDWDKSMLRVHSTKTNSERFVPIFPEIMRPLLDCFEQSAIGAEWVIENRCPRLYQAQAPPQWQYQSSEADDDV